MAFLSVALCGIGAVGAVTRGATERATGTPSPPSATSPDRDDASDAT